MSVDLNKLKDKLKAQRSVVVEKDGKLSDKNPNSSQDSSAMSTLKPKRAFVF